MAQVILRKNRLFVVNKETIASDNKEDICNALYAAIYTEFLGASKNPKYKNVPAIDMLQKINEYANEWLSKRGLLNE
jgi:hypothetical protein